MSANPQQTYDLQRDKSQIFPTYNAATQSQFETVAKPGLKDRAMLITGSGSPVTASIVDFTGSNFGAVAVLITVAGTNATASLSAGGRIGLSGLPTGIHDLGISRIESNDTGSALYVLIQTEPI